MGASDPNAVDVKAGLLDLQDEVDEKTTELLVCNKALKSSEMSVIQQRVEILTLRDVITAMTDCMLNYRPKK